MNYPIKTKNQKNYLQLLFLLEQYKSVSIHNYFTNNKLVILLFFYNYSLIHNYSTIFSTKSLRPITFLHTIWINKYVAKGYSLIIKKTSSINYISILPCFFNKHSYKKLYITTSCYNINRLVLSNNNLVNNIYIITILYYTKLLKSCNLSLYILNLNYLHYFNTLRNVPIIKLLGLNHNSLVTGTKLLTNHLWVNHNLKNL